MTYAYSKGYNAGYYGHKHVDSFNTKEFQFMYDAGFKEGQKRAGIIDAYREENYA
jgi:hypothetical protein|tara:strand:- start:226 stop:390 length:165 start_codon:yes stop_codon:yes gene_type:complete